VRHLAHELAAWFPWLGWVLAPVIVLLRRRHDWRDGWEAGRLAGYEEGSEVLAVNIQPPLVAGYSDGPYDWRDQTEHDLAPEHIQETSIDVPALRMDAPDDRSTSGKPIEGGGHLQPSPYGGSLTPRQRRRDRHKRRGEYAPDLPRPEVHDQGGSNSLRIPGTGPGQPPARMDDSRWRNRVFWEARWRDETAGFNQAFDEALASGWDVFSEWFDRHIGQETAA
jgi:hypothetical protein